VARELHSYFFTNRLFLTPTRKDKDMNWDQIEGKWKQFAAGFKSKWAKLTDDDWTLIGSKKDALVGKIQEKYGNQKEVAEREVDDYIKSL